MSDLSLWVSPHDPFQTVDDLVAAAKAVNMPGLTTRVLLPTAYGQYLQGTPGINRSIGDALAPATVRAAFDIRSAIEGQGIKCDGWAVPRGTGDPFNEGYLHGQLASVFETFYLNFEQWTSDENNPKEEFWTHPQRADIVNLYLTGFWKALADAGKDKVMNGHVGITWVTNSMLTNASDPVKVAFLGGTNFDVLEAYIPNDPNLDPANAKNIWAQTLARLGINNRPYTVILEQGDLPTLAQQYCDPQCGFHIWTLATASKATWPNAQTEDPQVIAELQAQVADLQKQLQDMTGSRDQLQGIDSDLGKQLDYCQQLKQQVESNLTDQVNTLNGQLKTSQDQVTQLQKQIEDLQTQLKSAQTDAAAAQTVEELKAALQKVMA